MGDKKPPDEVDVTFTDCDFSGNGMGGAKLGPGSYKFVSSRTNDNGGDGVELSEGASATFEKHESRGNKGHAISTLVEAIKKPTANGNRGLKIIVGSILIPILVGIAVYEYGVWRDQPNSSAKTYEQAS